MRSARLVCLVALCAAGCASSTSWKTFRTNGLSIRIPSDWSGTRRALTPVTSPVQVLAVASYPLPRGDARANGCSPKEALDRLPERGVFVFGWEYDRPSLSGVRKRDFPRRPAHFGLGRRVGFECLGPSYVVHFREHGRLLQIHVVLGPRAGDAEKKTAMRVLDSIAVS